MIPHNHNRKQRRSRLVKMRMRHITRIPVSNEMYVVHSLINKLTSNMKPAPPEVHAIVSKRPWDFICTKVNHNDASTNIQNKRRLNDPAQPQP